MNLMHMKYIVEVEKYGSVTKAASALYMGQPNLSKAIKEMEQEIGTPIFKRSVKGVVPTEKGKEFLKYAKEILAQLDKIENLHKESNINAQTFQLLFSGSSYITYAFAEFLKKLDNYENLDININETSALETIDKVVDDEYKLGVIRYSLPYEKLFVSMLEERKLVATEIWTYDEMVAVSKYSPLAIEAEVQSDMLESYVEITDDRALGLQSLLAKKSAVQHNDKKQIYVNERESKLNALSAISDTYMWSTPLPEQVLKRYGLTQLKCSDTKKTYCDVLICRKDYRMTDIDIKFLEELKRVKNSIKN